MELLINTSLATAFLAGMAALFAPCCITVLLPTYFASIFRQKRKVFLMTFIFFLGVLVVFLPLGLGFGVLGRLINQLHDFIYIFGAVMLMVLGFFILSGSHIAMPFSFAPKLKNQNAGSIFMLGIFSGLATTCCAPVLAGVLALSVLPGSIFWGGIYAFVYVLGMVLPLFIIAMFVDKVNFTEKFGFFKKSVRYSILSRDITISRASFISALMFVLMGALIIVLQLTGRLRMESTYQMTINIFSAKILNEISDMLGSIPVIILPVLFFGILIVIIRMSFKQIKSRDETEPPVISNQ